LAVVFISIFEVIALIKLHIIRDKLI